MHASVSASTAANDQQIREIAYLIWEQAGRPVGQAEWHWEMAKQMAAASRRAKTKLAGAKTRSRRKKADAKPAAN